MSADGTPPTHTINLPLADLRESRWQPAGRSERNIDEIAASIAAHGILEPLTVRQVDGHHEIVKGHRRRAGGLRAGLVEVPCVVRELTDEKALELFVVSNGHEEMTPVEEADVFGRAQADFGWTPEKIADRFGKSPATVHKRLILLRLIEPARAALVAKKLLVGVAEHLALLPEADQAQAVPKLTAGEEPAGRRVGLQILSAYQRSLADVPWQLGDALLVAKAGACTACPKRTGAQLPLLADQAPDGDRLDAACFDEKWKAEAGEEQAEEEARPSRSKARKSAPPPGPVTRPEPLAPPVDLEKIATEAAIKRAVAEVVAAAGRKKKIDVKALRFLVSLFARAAYDEAIDEIAIHRIGPGLSAGEQRNGILSVIAAEEREPALYAIGVELAVVGDPNLTSLSEDGCLVLAARHFGVDLDAIRAEELKRLKKEAKADKPIPGERAVSTPMERVREEEEAAVGRCRVCRCTDETPCAGATGPCGWANVEEDLCSVCADILDGFEDRLEHRARPASEVIDEILETTDSPGVSRERVLRALDDLKKVGVVVLADVDPKSGAILALAKKPKPVPKEPDRERSEVEKTARSKSVKSDVHILVKLPTGKRGKPPVKKVCELDEVPADATPTNRPDDSTCTGCRTAWALTEQTRKEAGL
jgi:ParB/RepB/Spo0J family partition protein